MPAIQGAADSNNSDGTEQNQSTTSKKGKKTKDSGKADPHEIYNAAARTIARCIDLWCNVESVVKIVDLLREDEASELGELDEEDAARTVREQTLSKISIESREQTRQTYYKIIQLVPAFQALVNNPEKRTEVEIICGKMNTTIKATRSNDATRLKTSIAQYALPNPYKPASLDPPIVNANGRAEMGLNHPILARWLCPADQLERFDENPEQACKDLASGAIRMGPQDFPTLFWSGEIPGKDYEPENMLIGLFKSYFLVRVGRHIFLGPSSALGGDTRATRSCNAVLHGMTTVEAEHIAYICIQARFAISSRSQWSETDGNLSYFKMYHSIISFIQDSPDPKWRDELLKWWNKEIFGDESGRGDTKTLKNDGSSGSTAPAQMSTMERLQAQMKARLAAPAPSPQSVIDPSLVAESTHTASDPPNKSPPAPTPPSTRPSDSAPSTSNTSNTAAPAGLSTAAPLPNLSAGPVTPRPTAPVAMTTNSPLTETDEELECPLTPVTNRKGKQTKVAKGKAKRPAPATDEGETGRAKKSRRTRGTRT